MEGKHLIVSVSSMPPFVSYTINEDKIILQGSFGQIWTILEERLKFSSQYMTESFNVGVSNFQNQRRDVLLHPAVISSTDVDKFDFTFPIDSTWYELYLRDSDEINSSNSYVRNWSMSLWVCTGIMIFLFTAILFLMLQLSSKFLRRDIYIVPNFESSFQLVQYYSHADKKFNLPKDWRKSKTENQKLKSTNERSLGNCFIAALAAFCSQGVILHTNVVSIRILKLFILIFGMIMSNSYSALLISQLTLGERFLQFETLEEIPVKGQGYSLCVRSESYPYLYFTVNNSKREIQPKWSKIVNRKPCLKDGVISSGDMCTPYVAFLETPSIMNEHILNHLNCKMTNLKKKYFEVDLSLILLKGFESKAKKELNIEIIKYNEVGILSYLRERWITREKVGSQREDQEMQVTYEHIAGVLLVYAFCLGFSLSLFFFEVLIYFIFKKRFYNKVTNKVKNNIKNL